MGIQRLIVAGLLLASLWPSVAEALSVTARRSHDPKLAREEVERVVAAIDSNDEDRFDDLVGGPLFYTDTLGYVEYEEREAFLAGMNSSDGRADAAPIKITQFRRLLNDKFDPVYVVTLQREVWKLKDSGMDGCGNLYENDHPHFETEISTWLVTFSSNQIAYFREADELFAATHS